MSKRGHLHEKEIKNQLNALFVIIRKNVTFLLLKKKILVILVDSFFRHISTIKFLFSRVTIHLTLKSKMFSQRMVISLRTNVKETV